MHIGLHPCMKTKGNTLSIFKDNLLFSWEQSTCLGSCSAMCWASLASSKLRTFSMASFVFCWERQTVPNELLKWTGHYCCLAKLYHSWEHFLAQVFCSDRGLWSVRGGRGMCFPFPKKQTKQNKTTNKHVFHFTFGFTGDCLCSKNDNLWQNTLALIGC